MSSPMRGPVLWAVCNGGVGVGGGGVSARRCLFGAVDHAELQRDYRLLMKAELEDASRRWNFDFTADKPQVGGVFKWVGLPQAQVPFLYHQCTVGVEPLYKREEPLSNGAGPLSKGAEPPSALETEDANEAAERNNRNTQGAEKHTLKRKQTNITDFYQAKRRIVTTRKSGQ